MVTVIFFGSLSDHISPSTQSIDLGSSAKTASEIFNDFAEAQAGLADAKASQPIKVALNQKMADWEAIVSNGDEIAFLPPVTGG